MATSDMGVSATKEGVEAETEAGPGFCGVGSSSKTRTVGGGSGRPSPPTRRFRERAGVGVQSTMRSSSSSERRIGSDIFGAGFFDRSEVLAELEKSNGDLFEREIAGRYAVATLQIILLGK